MTDKTTVRERRKHERFKVDEGIYAAVGPGFNQVGPIIDVGMGGLSFYYTAREQQPGGLSLDIIFTTGAFRLDYIPFKSVSDLEITDPGSPGPASKRRTSVQFGKLTPYQELLLTHFVNSQFTGAQ
jgi:hypothetical protein